MPAQQQWTAGPKQNQTSTVNHSRFFNSINNTTSFWHHSDSLIDREWMSSSTQLKGCPISVPSTGCLQRSHHVKTLQPTYDFFWRNGLHDFLLRNLRMILTVLIIKPIIISDLRGIQPKRDPCDRHLIQINKYIYRDIYIIFIHTELVVSQISFGMQYGRFLLRCPQWCGCFSPC